MKLKTNGFIQFFSILGHGFAQYGGLLPETYRIPVSLGLGIIQGVVALVGHFSNTNGTPQEIPGGAAAPKLN